MPVIFTVESGAIVHAGLSLSANCRLASSTASLKPASVSFRSLVSSMTLEEKVSQVGHTADAIPRLGVPEYNWWNEGLHGVARAG